MDEKYEIQEIGQTFLYAALCVPSHITDEEAAETMFISGTSGGWQIAEDQSGVTQNCAERPGCRHLLLEC